MKFYLSLVLFALMLFASETMARSQSEDYPPPRLVELSCCDMNYCTVEVTKEQKSEVEEIQPKEIQLWIQRQKNTTAFYFIGRAKNKDVVHLEKSSKILESDSVQPDFQCPYREHISR